MTSRSVRPTTQLQTVVGLDPHVADALRSRLADVADRAVLTIIEEVPSYTGALTGRMGEVIRNAVQLALGGFLTLATRQDADAPKAPAIEGAYQLGRGEARSGRTVEALLAATAVLALASAGVQISKHGFGHGGLLGVGRMLDMELEGNVPSWFSGTLLLACSMMFAFIWASVRQRQEENAAGWAVLALVSLAASIDEVSAVHETVGERLQGGGDAFIYLLPGSLLLLGIALGAIGAWWLSRYIAALLFETKPFDVLTYVGVAVLLMTAAAAACYVPGRRAMSIDPAVALRIE